MASSSSASIGGGGDGDPFDIPAKGASIERLRRWRKVVLVLNASRRFRYTLDEKKEERKEEVRREIRAHATVLRADSHFKEAGRASFQSRETAVASADCELGFGIQEDKLTTLTRDHNSSALEQYGGISGIAHKLNTDTDKGISGHDSDLTASRNAFGSNTYPRKKQRSFLAFMWDACKDPSLIILMVAAVLSVALGITSEGKKEGWYDGASIAFAVLLVVFVTALNDYKQARQFQFLNEEKENKKLEVVRGGRRIMISTYDLVVGDVVPLKIGDEVPADGIVISGHSFWIDESSMTGEPALEWKAQSTFLMAGCKVADGYGTMLVTAVGINTVRGLLMASISEDSGEETPLQVRLNGVATFIGRFVFCVALAVVAVLLARYFTGHTHNPDGSAQYVKGKIGVGQIILVVVLIFTVVVSVVVVAVPEGLPLAVTLTLAFSLRKMIKDKALLRRLSACETMGSATTICSGKTGTLTLNQMRVVEAYFGGKKMDSPNNAQILPTNVTSLITEGIAQNTTGSIFESESGQEPEVTGSPTEKAILSWGLELGMRFNETRSKSSILHVSPFNSEKKRSGIAVRLDGEVHIHWKGAAEIVLDSCTSWLDHDGLKHSMTPEKVTEFRNFIEDMAAASLRCVAFAYSTRGMDDVPNENQRPRWKLPEDNLIMLGIVGIEDPCRPGVQDSIRLCAAAGIKVRMVTGDNLQTARAIALECGILTDHDVSEPNNIIEGKTFRVLSDSAREEVADKIVVMGRSSPNDKYLLVKALKKRGHVVAVTGDDAYDAPALFEADIGLSMGIQGTEVAKESSDIIILDDNFSSVVRVVRWGRSVYANIQRFIQFQFTVNIAALIINVVVAFCSGDMPFNAVQLLWVNIVIDTLGALALATGPPTNCLMQRPPIGKREPLITNIMWRNLIIMVCFQVSVLLTLYFKGKRLTQLKNDNPAHAYKLKNTFIFNTFVLFQVFNAFNSRKLDELNIFKGITRNHLFVAIIVITVILQALIIEFFGKFASTVKLSWQLWLISIGLAFFCWPLSLVGKLIPVPDRPFGELIPCCGGDRPFREFISRCGGYCVVACTCLPVVIGSFLAWLALAFANL